MPNPKKRSNSGEQMDVAKITKVVDDSSIQQRSAASDLDADKFDAPTVESPLNRNTESDKASVSGTSIVTPEKAAPAQRLFLMNTKSGTYVETESSVSAKLLQSQLVRLGSEPNESYAIAAFNSELDVREFLRKEFNVPKPIDHNVEVPTIPANNTDDDDSRKMAAVSFPSLNTERIVANVVADRRKMPAVSFSSNNSERNMPNSNRNVSNASDIEVLKDDVVAFRSVQSDTPRLGSIDTPRLGSTSLSTSEIGAIRAVTLGIGARIEVSRWSLPACKFDVYSYKLMVGSNMYWTHKPTMWFDLARMKSEKAALDNHESMSLHEAMDYCHAAAIRSTPGGPNTALVISTKKTPKIFLHVLYGFVPKEKPDTYISEQIKKFVRYCNYPWVRQSYNTVITTIMNSNPAIHEDTKEDGKYWFKLQTGSENITIFNKKYLNEVFLDEDIAYIIERAYSLHPPTTLWPPHVQAVAYGHSVIDA
jgi:hypothetical protein